MAIHRLDVKAYQSLRDVHLELSPLTVVVGANGSGKTNLYRSLVLLQAAAAGRLAWALAEEGGMPSVLWAGGRRKGPVRMLLGVVFDTIRYELALGLPEPGYPAPFMLDPEVKEETLSVRHERKDVVLAERKATSAFVRDGDGVRTTYAGTLRTAESLLGQLEDPHRYPVLSTLREQILAWRFYHHFRSDLDAPMRRPQIGIETPVLAHDGRDLAAALETIRQIGDPRGLDEVVARAFPGAALSIASENARFEVQLELPGMSRPLHAGELSDGTLRYLCLAAALMSPRPPPLLALNEPETSLHPDLFEPLAELIVGAARRSQLLVTTHAGPLADAIAARAGTSLVRLEKVNGETKIA